MTPSKRRKLRVQHVLERRKLVRDPAISSNVDHIYHIHLVQEKSRSEERLLSLISPDIHRVHFDHPVHKSPPVSSPSRFVPGTREAGGGEPDRAGVGPDVPAPR